MLKDNFDKISSNPIYYNNYSEYVGKDSYEGLLISNDQGLFLLL